MLPPTVLPRFAIVFVALAVALRSQVAWQQLTTAVAPSARAWHAAAMDPGARVLVFGGLPPSFVSTDDTWLFDGLSWTQPQTIVRPPPRYCHQLVHDVARGRIVLFGGNGQFGFVNDTWEWDGATWLARNPAHRPSARRNHGMAFDLPRGRTVLFGGDAMFFFVGDTWEWDGIDWTQVVGATSPSPRDAVGMAADTARGRIVLFGGKNPALLNDTWEFDGQGWNLRQPATAPPGRYGTGMVYDMFRQRTVMFGGSTQTMSHVLGDTWEWDGSDWRQRTPQGGASPSARCAAAMVYDLYRGVTVMFGGGTSALALADTTRYAALWPARCVRYGSGCGGAVGVPEFVPLAGSAPWLGDAWGLQLALLPTNAPAFLVLGTSRTTWGTTSLPLSLAPFGLPGCSLLASPDASLFTVASGQVATWPIAIPANQALLGMTMFAQGAGMDLTANAGGLVVGNALEVTLGGR